MDTSISCGERVSSNVEEDKNSEIRRINVLRTFTNRLVELNAGSALTAEIKLTLIMSFHSLHKI